MPKRLVLFLIAASFVIAAVAAAPAVAATPPSGERVLGQSTLEPVYNAENAGQIGFVMTPNKAPLNANPRAWSPFYVVVYPVGSAAANGGLLCQDTPSENCPDHGPQIAAAAAAAFPGVYGVLGVAGHDHLMDFPGGRDWNVAWEPIIVLFTNTTAANNDHLLTDAAIEAAFARGDVIEVPMPALTFHCQRVSAAVWARAK